MLGISMSSVIVGLYLTSIANDYDVLLTERDVRFPLCSVNYLPFKVVDPWNAELVGIYKTPDS